jgi:anti-anti-sigma regulatory factor
VLHTNAWLIEPDVLCVSLPAEPRVQPELMLLRKYLSERESLHLIIDLSHVEILSSPGIGGLLLLRQMQVERGNRLLLCNMALATKCVLRVVGLDSVFDYAVDKADALRAIRPRTESVDETPLLGSPPNDHEEEPHMDSQRAVSFS